MQFKVLKFTVAAMFLLIFSAYAEAGPSPPEYSESQDDLACFGPKHKTVNMFHYGRGDHEYWLIEPASPRPDTAPLIVFNHGYMATTPQHYGAWIDHIVKRGNIVIFPAYQRGIISDPEKFTSNVIHVIKDAISKFETEKEHVPPALDKVAFVGHSAGGLISANLAAIADKEDIPVPGALMCVNSGKSWVEPNYLAIPLEDLSKINSSTLLLAVTADNDTVVKDIDTKKIFKESTNVPLSNKNYIILMSDNHGMPQLSATHYTPSAPIWQYGGCSFGTNNIESITIDDFSRFDNFMDKIDALDFYGLWKFFDGLCDAAFYDKNKEYALGNTPEQKFMGLWSNGKPVREPIITDYP